MSDTGRKGVMDQASESMKPDSQKTTYEKASETVTSTADKAMGAVQPCQSPVHNPLSAPDRT